MSFAGHQRFPMDIDPERINRQAQRPLYLYGRNGEPQLMTELSTDGPYTVLQPTVVRNTLFHKGM